MGIAKFPPGDQGTTPVAFVTVPAALTAYAYYLLIEKDPHKVAKVVRGLSVAEQVEKYPTLLAIPADPGFWNVAGDAEKYIKTQEALSHAATEISQLAKDIALGQNRDE